MLCPHCGEESFARKKKLTRGWKIVGEVEVCALCGMELKNSSPESASGEKKDSSRERLAALLGGYFTDKVSLPGSADNRFCRNCRHFLVHPFKSVCALTDREADPMGECADFAAKELNGESGQ